MTEEQNSPTSKKEAHTSKDKEKMKSRDKPNRKSRDIPVKAEKRLCRTFENYVGDEYEKLWEKICKDLDSCCALPRLNKVNGYSTTVIKKVVKELSTIGWHGIVYRTSTNIKFILCGDKNDLLEMRKEAEDIKANILFEF